MVPLSLAFLMVCNRGNILTHINCAILSTVLNYTYAVIRRYCMRLSHYPQPCAVAAVFESILWFNFFFIEHELAFLSVFSYKQSSSKPRRPTYPVFAHLLVVGLNIK